MPTNDELQAVREAYYEFEDSLEGESSPARRGAWVLVGNAAAEYIVALEAHIAAQQQRIAELERALEPIQRVYHEYLNADLDEMGDMFAEWIDDGAVQGRILDAMAIAFKALDALHADGE